MLAPSMGSMGIFVVVVCRRRSRPLLSSPFAVAVRRRRSPSCAVVRRYRSPLLSSSSAVAVVVHGVLGGSRCGCSRRESNREKVDVELGNVAT